MSNNYQQGKWYTCKRWKSKYDYIKLDYIQEDKVYFTECISDKNHNFIKDYWVFNELIPVDLSEISEYLPEEHPDKKIEFIPGEWYICKEYNFLGKFLKLNSREEFVCSEFYLNYYQKTEYPFCSGYDWELATEEDLKKYIPELFEKPSIKVFGNYDIGDIVISLEKVGTLRFKGDLFKILDKSTESHLYYGEKNSSSNRYQWRKATEEEIKAYNNGIKNIKDIIPTKNNSELKEEIITKKTENLLIEDIQSVEIPLLISKENQVQLLII